MIDDLRRAMTWPLRPLGLLPGQALHNAHPSDEQIRITRAELRACIEARCAAIPSGEHRSELVRAQG